MILGKFINKNNYKFFYSRHHESHAAAGFYPSPFQEAVVLCMDGVGEWATTSTWIGKDNKIKQFLQFGNLDCCQNPPV